jgi:hypothetical protein
MGAHVVLVMRGQRHRPGRFVLENQADRNKAHAFSRLCLVKYLCVDGRLLKRLIRATTYEEGRGVSMMV